MSEEQYHSASHCKYLTQYHIIWRPKFRFSVLQKGADDKLKNILADICNQYGYEIKALEVMPDHRPYTYIRGLPADSCPLRYSKDAEKYQRY